MRADHTGGLRPVRTWPFCTLCRSEGGICRNDNKINMMDAVGCTATGIAVFFQSVSRTDNEILVTGTFIWWVSQRKGVPRGYTQSRAGSIDTLLLSLPFFLTDTCVKFTVLMVDKRPGHS